MKIVIHGTYGGYKTLTPERPTGLFDVRPDLCKEKAVGQKAYAIQFNEDSVIFSKYRIIRDGIGDLRTGNIAFSVIIPDGEKLAGVSVKELLDELEKSFFGRNNINNGFVLEKVSNNWAFVDNIKNTYETKLEIKPKLYFKQGEHDAAFIYYSSDEDLIKFLDTPDRDGYYNYKQIFFVQQELKGKPENPLNALWHSENDLTFEISPEPPKPVIPPTTVPVEPVNFGNGSTEEVKNDAMDEKKTVKTGFSSSNTKSKSPPLYSNLRLLVTLVIIAAVSVSLVMGFMVILKNYEATKNKHNEKIKEIQEYVKGGKFLKDTLESYRTYLKEDTVKYNNVLKSINSAIKIRGMIDTADIAQLKESGSELRCCGNSSLDEFTTAIDGIVSVVDSAQSRKIKERLDKIGVSALDLNLISLILPVISEKCLP